MAGSDIPLMLKMGAKVKVCGPHTLVPKHIEELGVTFEPNLRKALEWCDVANVLRIQLERMDIKFIPSLREYSLYYGINKDLLDSINKPITIMHPGPINRGVEITSDVADSEHSIIFQRCGRMGSRCGWRCCFCWRRRWARTQSFSKATLLAQRTQWNAQRTQS